MTCLLFLREITPVTGEMLEASARSISGMESDLGHPPFIRENRNATFGQILEIEVRSLRRTPYPYSVFVAERRIHNEGPVAHRHSQNLYEEINLT